MKGAFPSPGSTFEAVPPARARQVGVLEVKVPSVEPFTRPVRGDVVQDVMDAHPAGVDPEERA
jgi:hypothetical protein